MHSRQAASRQPPAHLALHVGAPLANLGHRVSDCLPSDQAVAPWGVFGPPAAAGAHDTQGERGSASTEDRARPWVAALNSGLLLHHQSFACQSTGMPASPLPRQLQTPPASCIIQAPYSPPQSGFLFLAPRPPSAMLRHVGSGLRRRPHLSRRLAPGVGALQVLHHLFIRRLLNALQVDRAARRAAVIPGLAQRGRSARRAPNPAGCSHARAWALASATAASWLQQLSRSWPSWLHTRPRAYLGIQLPHQLLHLRHRDVLVCPQAPPQPLSMQLREQQAAQCSSRTAGIACESVQREGRQACALRQRN